jgi:protein-disulfide isomerase
MFTNPIHAEAAGEDIAKALREIQRDIGELRNEVAQLRQAVTEIHKANVPNNAPPPSPPPVSSVSLDDDPSIGAATAKIGIVEFSDYQCPFCLRYHSQTFPQVKEKYIDTGKVRYVFRDYPLDFHEQAQSAAIAANCAGRQNAYWPMQAALFTNQQGLGMERYQKLAEELKLDKTAFDACLQDENQAKEVAADLAYGQSVGVTGTPSFFVGIIENGELKNARLIAGAQVFESFKNAVESLEAQKQ